MKLTLLSTLLCITTASAFLTPTTTTTNSFNRLPTTFLRESEDGAEADSDDYRGSMAISALTADVKTVFSSEDIAKILPHRYPFLLVDKVVEYEAGKVRCGC